MVKFKSKKYFRNPINIEEKHRNNEPIIFQSIDWYDCDFKYDIDDDEKKLFKLNRENNKRYTIFAFGVTKDGNSVCCRINKFKPYFYIRIPDEYDESQIEIMKSYFSKDFAVEQEKISNDEITEDIIFESMYYKSGISEADTTIEKKEIFWKFMNNAKFRFLKIHFISNECLKLFFNILRKPINLGMGIYNYNLFEADFEPILRFFHDKKINPSGWQSVKNYSIADKQSKCQINIECDFEDIIPYDCNDIAPLRIAAFDIEADSSHGDFPIANKTCQKLANQLIITWIRDIKIIQKYDKQNSNIFNEKLIEAKRNINKKSDFFRERIKQALYNINDKYKKKYFVDDEIDYLYLQECRNKDYKHDIKEKLKSYEFKKLCNNIYDMVKLFDPSVKIKANTEMKKIINAITEAEANYIKKYNTITWSKLHTIIDTVYKKNKNQDIIKKDICAKFITKDIIVHYTNRLLNQFFGDVEGDHIIQIGTVFWTYGDEECFHNNIITLKNCDDFGVGNEKCEIISYDYSDYHEINDAEKQILLAWTILIEKYDPDIIIGYNTFGFDMAFMYDRAIDLFKYDEDRKYDYNYHNKYFNKFINMGRLHNNMLDYCNGSKGRIINKKLSSSALGDNFLYYFNMPGRVQIDLLKVCQSSMDKLPSYKLDDVANYYISGSIVGFGEEHKPGYTYEIKVKNIKEIDDGNFIIISMSTTGQQLYDGKKIAIKKIDRENNILIIDKEVPTNCLPYYPKWGLAKDDVKPKDIFRLQNGSDSDRSIVAKYCIQDCVLLIRLLKKLEVIPSNIGMSNVSIIPFNYIFIRGQGIKIFSLIVNECSNRGFVLPTLDKVTPDEVDINHDSYVTTSKTSFKGSKDIQDFYNTKTNNNSNPENLFTLANDFNVIVMSEDSYEGAIVLKPKPNIYFVPISVLDFSSLYPSEMIASDLSHDRIVEDEIWLGEEGKRRLFDLGYDVIDRQYDNYTWIDPSKKSKGKKKIGVCTVRFVQPHSGEKGLIPQVLMKLLAARKATKKKLKAEKDPFKKSILDGLQLAYKLTANSLYGQIGARTSKIFKKEIAASTTAGGRENIYKAKDFCLKNNPGCDVVYGDTDSVFVKLNLDYNLEPSYELSKELFEKYKIDYYEPDRSNVIKRSDGSIYPITKEDQIKRSMEISLWIQQKLKDDKIFTPPHDLEYEKVYFPLILITKKRYIGIKYEFNPDEGKKTSMGVVTKRRDNAPILKHIFIGVVDTLMKECNLYKAIDFVRDTILKMINDEYDLNMFVTSKTLKEYYKDPESIAHKVLAMRMAERDPGNKPSSNERIPYVYIKIEEKPGIEYLQGDRIEHIDYVRENNLQVDYAVYITNQIMKPVSQIFELVVEKLPKFPYPKLGEAYFNKMAHKYYDKYNGDLVKLEKKMHDEKCKMVKKLIFEDLIQIANKKTMKIKTIDDFYKPKITSVTNNNIDYDKFNISNQQIIESDNIVIEKNKKQLNITNYFGNNKDLTIENKKVMNDNKNKINKKKTNKAHQTNLTAFLK